MWRPIQHETRGFDQTANHPTSFVVEDFQSVKKLERIIVNEYIRFLRLTGDRDTLEPWITDQYFEHYVRTRSSFVAEADAKVVGFILSQPTSYVHNSARENWLEYLPVALAVIPASPSLLPLSYQGTFTWDPCNSQA